MPSFRSIPRVLAALMVFAASQGTAQVSAGPQGPVEALSLAAASEALLRDNPSIRLARRAAEVASSEVRRVNVSPNPTVSAEISNTMSRQYTYGGSDRLFRIEQLFERGGKRQLRVDYARTAETAAFLDLADAIRQQRAALAQGYFDLAAAQRLVEIAEQNAADLTRLEEAAQRRLRAGDVSAVEVSRLRVESSRLRNEVRAAQAVLDEARIRLASLLGADARAGSLFASDPLPDPATDDPGADLLPPVAQGRIDEVLRRRADAAAALTRVEALATAARLAESLRTRDVTLGVKSEHAPSFGGTVYGVTVSVPLMINNDYSGEVLRAQAERAQAEEDLQRIRGAVRADIERSASQLAAARDRARRLALIALPEARRAAEGVAFAYERGAAGLTDLLDARRQFAAVRADSVLARAEYARALAACRASLAIEETP